MLLAPALEVWDQVGAGGYDQQLLSAGAVTCVVEVHRPAQHWAALGLKMALDMVERAKEANLLGAETDDADPPPQAAREGSQNAPHLQGHEGPRCIVSCGLGSIVAVVVGTEQDNLAFTAPRHAPDHVGRVRSDRAGSCADPHPRRPPLRHPSQKRAALIRNRETRNGRLMLRRCRPLRGPPVE